jgi:hypothetical protein
MNIIPYVIKVVPKIKWHVTLRSAGTLAIKLPILVTFVTSGKLMFVNSLSKRVGQVLGHIYCMKDIYIFFLHIFILTHDFY